MPASRTRCVVLSSSVLKAIKSFPWAMSVDGHGRYAAGAVCQAAKAAFGAPARRPRREHIDCAAWALICDRRTVETWCRERRVSATTRVLFLGAPPTLSGCSCGPLAGAALLPWRALSLASSLPRLLPLLKVLVPRMGSGSSLGLSCATAGVCSRGHLKAAGAAFLGATACELDAAQADRAHDLAWRRLRSLTCRGGAKWKGAKSLPGGVGEDGVAATTTQEVSGVVLKHFAAIEAAEGSSVEALADRHGRFRSALAFGALRDIKFGHAPEVVCPVEAWQSLRH